MAEKIGFRPMNTPTHDMQESKYINSSELEFICNFLKKRIYIKLKLHANERRPEWLNPTKIEFEPSNSKARVETTQHGRQGAPLHLGTLGMLLQPCTTVARRSATKKEETRCRIRCPNNHLTKCRNGIHAHNHIPTACEEGRTNDFAVAREVGVSSDSSAMHAGDGPTNFTDKLEVGRPANLTVMHEVRGSINLTRASTLAS